MGQANALVAFHTDVNSPSLDGLKSVLSEPIEAMTPDEFWALFSMDLRSRHCPPPEEEKRAAESEGLLVFQGGRIYEWFLFHSLDEAECYCYGSDSTLSKLESRGTLKVHRSPFRIEYWSLIYGQRESGDRLKAVMMKILRTMRSKADCSLNVDSPGNNGLKCVLSEPIMDSILSPDMFWKQTKEFIKKKAEKVLPDGGIVQKAAAGWELFETQAAYTKHIFNESTKEIVSYTYKDSDLSETSLETVRHLRIHVKPYRLEMWMASADKRQAGYTEKEELLTLLEPVLEQAQLMEAYPNSVANTSELSSLFEEVTAFRKEMSNALSALHEGAGALQAW
mmetsp:Transcript_79911/g.185557  ORF Transcript_79911/g.185557 Transcript_79911/m.185557 type:complete len:337 (-) Transcript_79911:373-1383(-)|eukprot:CAMPEP_0171098362 /NCGR_PEP_ID=MMETSP0766_2-20121228/48074_1 /TAXON_ID=439317 /ORGANISM="Gambierdiscus australes, Strain CAWD 149" /LENGTH=336 /DNA_ID=CAMNT_0011557689 /DNA_START=60 /DNA_END=1070 /DNA_ORIENTATION=-